jgi:hypothetical protein
MNKKLILFSATVFGLIGGYIPVLWGDNDMLSGTSLLLGMFGGFFGIWIGYLFSKRFS